MNMTARRDLSPAAAGTREKISFDDSTGSLQVRLEALGLVQQGGVAGVVGGTALAGSVLVIGGRVDIAGEVEGHVVAIDSDVHLAAAGKVGRYLYLVDSRLEVEERWNSRQRFHSTVLPRPWARVEAEGLDLTGELAAKPAGARRTWRFDAEAAVNTGPEVGAPAEKAGVVVDTSTGSTEIRGGLGPGVRRFIVDGVDRSDWFAPFASQAMTFSGGPVIAFGSGGARFRPGRDEWSIPAGNNVVALTGEGYAVVGARGGVRYEVGRRRLVGRDALVRHHSADGVSSYAGAEVALDLEAGSVEARP